jgi:hypothetical protein
VIDAVERERERIVGLIELVPYVHGKTPEGIVQDQMERLSEDNMIGANAGGTVAASVEIGLRRSPAI